MESADDLHLAVPQAIVVTCAFCNEQHDYDALAMAMALNGLQWLTGALNNCIQCVSRVLNKRLSYTIGDPAARERLFREIKKHPTIAEITFSTRSGSSAILLTKPGGEYGAPLEIRIYG